MIVFLSAPASRPRPNRSRATADRCFAALTLGAIADSTTATIAALRRTLFYKSPSQRRPVSDKRSNLAIGPAHDPRTIANIVSVCKITRDSTFVIDEHATFVLCAWLARRMLFAMHAAERCAAAATSRRSPGTTRAEPLLSRASARTPLRAAWRGRAAGEAAALGLARASPIVTSTLRCPAARAEAA